MQTVRVQRKTAGRGKALRFIQLGSIGGIVEIIAILIVAVLLLALAGWVAFLEYRYQNLARSFRLLMTGRGGADLEATLQGYIGRMDRIETLAQAMEDRSNKIEARFPYFLQHIGVVRFNPFPDKGGDQSFTVALLDDQADGVVLSGLHSRVDSRVYAKPVVRGQSSYTLTGEEKEAIARAMAPRS